MKGFQKSALLFFFLLMSFSCSVHHSMEQNPISAEFEVNSGIYSVFTKDTQKAVLELGNIPTNEDREYQLVVRNRSDSPQSLIIKGSNILVTWDNGKDVIEIPAQGSKNAFLKINAGSTNKKEQLVIQGNSKTHVKISIRYTPMIGIIKRTAESRNRKAALGSEFSKFYELALGKAPRGYSYIEDSVRYWLTGDRICGSYSKCELIGADDKEVRFQFSLQGHSEAPQSIRYSKGHISAKYKLKTAAPILK